MRLSILLSLLVTGCTNRSSSTPQTPVERGRVVYNTNCIACHNANPRLDGNVGPALFGSSLELVQNRVMKAAYPPGYKPKRETHIMAALTYLKDEIPNLHAYLNSP